MKSVSLSVSANGIFGTQQEKTQAAGKGKNVFFAGESNLTEDPIEQRRKTAQKRALQVVGAVWENEQSVNRDIQTRREQYAQMQARKKEAQEQLADVRKDEKVLQQLYEVPADSREQQELELLKKAQDWKNHVGEALTQEEKERLAEIDLNNLTEYQRRALELNERAAVFQKTAQQEERKMQEAVSAVKQILLEKLKTHPMVDAQKAAEDILEAANGEIIGMLVQDAVDQADDKLEEEKEAAKEAAEEKEQREERLDELAGKRAMEEALIEGTREAAERAKEKQRQVEMPDMDFTDMLTITAKQQLSEEAKQSLAEIKSSMKLLEADLKGIRVADEI